jgi:2-polyprenyl-3-methyl-5-hydroxy-6-metoxy-1,4-benzoquinol methylase
MIHYLQCPVCKNTSIHYSFSAKDNTVSKETFEIWKCDSCTALFTQDVPSENEIGAYYSSQDYISHSDTREGLVNQIYHQVRNFTIAEKKRLVEKETGVAAGKILDVGCGTGAFLDKMKKGGWQVTGVEPDQGAREKAASLYNIQPKSPAELFSLPAGHFDAITLWHVLEHVHNLHEYIDQLKVLLAQKGRLFIAVPNYTSDDAVNYKEHWAAFDVPRHLYHFSPHSMNVLMNMHGMQIKQMKPMWFDSFYVSMLSEQNKSGKGNILSAVVSGLTSNAKALFNQEKCSSVIYIVGRN